MKYRKPKEENEKKEKKVKKTNKKNVEGTNPSGNKKEKSTTKKKVLKVLKVMFFVGLALVVVGSGVVFGVVSGIINSTKTVDLDKIGNQKQTTFYYDKEEKEIGSSYDVENRVITEYKDIPKNLINAVMAIEDERFLTHKGIDIKRTGAAVIQFVLSGGKSDFGGSTITQQLVKNIADDKESSWKRKIREWYRALTLETQMEKDQIMASYLNTIYFASNSYGIEIASQNYFGKSVRDINLAEAAALAAAIQTPEATNPYRSAEAKQKLLDRQEIVLNKMLELGMINEQECNDAKKFEIVFKKSEIQEKDSAQSYFVDAVFEQVVKDLAEQKGVTKEAAITMIYSNGYKVYTTMDSKVQAAIDTVYNDTKLFYTDKDGRFMQSSMVVMDQTNGHVVGLMGGAGKKEGDRSLNRATSIYKSPGSTIKPIVDYGPAFELGKLAPGMGVDDSPLDSESYQPGNYYGYFNGYVTARQAISKSMNLPAVRALRMTGVDYAYNFAKNCGLTSLLPEDKNLSLALAGMKHGVTVMELCNAYATFANKGVYVEPKLYTKVLDKDGKEVLKTETVAKKVMEESTAYMVTSCLQTVVTSGTGAGNIRVGNMPVAGKTGNTNDDFDQWFAGYTPYYTIACWNGYDKNKVIGYRKGIGSYPYTSMVLFNRVMNEISKNQPIKQFERPSTIVTANVCKVSGMVATDACKKDPRGSQEASDIFATGKIPTDTCKIHKMATICKETGLLAAEYCPVKEEKSFITRGYTLTKKTSDDVYMIPTKTCEKHTTKPVDPEEPENPDIYVYGNKPKN